MLHVVMIVEVGMIVAVGTEDATDDQGEKRNKVGAQWQILRAPSPVDLHKATRLRLHRVHHQAHHHRPIGSAVLPGSPSAVEAAEVADAMTAGTDLEVAETSCNHHRRWTAGTTASVGTTTEDQEEALAILRRGEGAGDRMARLLLIFC